MRATAGVARARCTPLAHEFILAVLNIRSAQIVLIALAGFALLGCQKSDTGNGDVYVPRPKGTITFNKEIAPIVFQNCSPCHRVGESAPFTLLGYEDVRKRTKLILDVTQRRVMPPWLPDPTVVHFVGERRLSAVQLGLIQQWAAEGAAEGRAGDLPPLPEWKSRWQLGEPDLVLRPAVAFKLAAEGRDVYRNLLVPIPVNGRRYVRGLEFRPNSRAVHHAFLRFDKTGEVLALDGKDGQPGFYGLHTPKSAESPVTFASWQPGKTPRFYPADLAWPVESNTVLVLQLHLNAIGKEEPVAPEVAVYFTDQPGTAIAFKLPLNIYILDIPAGVSNHTATDSFVLPIDVEIRGVLPHAHYLCREMKGYADLPDGRRQWLMAIKQWDFNWQGDYQFERPLPLPKGTKLVMEYTYDNSTNNARNPNHPPQPVHYGMNSTDEMGELWLLTVMKSPQDSDTLQRALQPRFLSDSILNGEMMLRRNPRDAKAMLDIGSALVLSGKHAPARERLRQALEINSQLDEAHYFLGLSLRGTKQLPEARQEFENAVRINPRHARARGNLGLVLAEQGDLPAAAYQFEQALQLNPKDEIARDMLKQIRQAMGQPVK
jgi:hypothetical protein